MSNRIYSDYQNRANMQPVAPRTSEEGKPQTSYHCFSGSPDALPISPGPRILRFPSGLEMEQLPPRRRPLWPLLTFALLIWAAVARCAYYLAA